MEIINYKKVFDFGIIESLLISYEYIYDTNEFELVTDSTNQFSEENSREFVMLSFKNVSSFKRMKGIYRFLKNTEKKFKCHEIQMSVLLQDLTFKKINKTHYTVNIYFGHSFGAIEMDFMTLEVNTKRAIGKLVQNGDWEYVEKDTGNLIDFYEPFKS